MVERNHACPALPSKRGLTAAIARLFVAATMAVSVPLPAYPTANTPTLHLAARKAMPAPAGFGQLCGRHAWLCASTGSGRPAHPDALKLADSINRKINHQVRQISDRRQYGREDVWALPTARGGDCEDFAMLKKLRLIEAGLRAETLLVATVLDRNRAPHAVLVLRTTGGDYILDNLRDRIVPWQQTGYSFLLMQDPRSPARWTAVFAGGIFSRAA